MSIKEEINQLLKEMRYEELVARTLENQGTLRYLFRLLYHPFGLERWRAIAGLGYITEAMLQNSQGDVREIIRRLLWSMNDESGTTSWSAPEAIGEIIYHNPNEFAEFVPIVVNASEEEIFHRGIVWTLGRVGSKEPGLVREFMPLLINFLSHPKPEVRGHAARSLGQMGSEAKGALLFLGGLLKDNNEIEVYESNQIINIKIRDLAQRAMKYILSTA
ncbi:HEAT domain containing protein [Desulforamulus reducens MI-1]|uniref:HEAT domain containing protein n=1 Tax=Desulforamulus reducens (strain ATCC BAA-1160 / DSM 100696 / MI-1) TaxID=349161 RepID=A4J8M9_DESRM|nr:DVU0298 family protein [Desulforamulus reducens]ABO51432.1 HEAT domain containing protein [Desulforamulus reducens MI-1]